MNNIIRAGVAETYYPIWIKSEKFDKLFVYQNAPEIKFFIKDKEITTEKLIELLEQIEY